uniref:Predicted protein n=1 Tax=Hordeum vulgare subsp. vulgare TaxID=112509 RepID=F2D511_HORVV|nr:predicted protein [Hordeum vulgare subsp. vulgare]
MSHKCYSLFRKYVSLAFKLGTLSLCSLLDSGRFSCNSIPLPMSRVVVATISLFCILPSYNMVILVLCLFSWPDRPLLPTLYLSHSICCSLMEKKHAQLGGLGERDRRRSCTSAYGRGRPWIGSWVVVPYRCVRPRIGTPCIRLRSGYSRTGYAPYTPLLHC